MTKKDLIDSLALEVDISKKKAGDAINHILDAITLSLEKGEKVTLVGFGTFKIQKRAERMGMNPSTLEKIRIPSTKVPKFKAGKKLKDAVR
ncbi:MAG: HU family DNA-binding protein [Candidatus Cloacimonadota bacterium]|nr:HU family DNA-binding protein [Candidatus Cloacimonadota bacterium]